MLKFATGFVAGVYAAQEFKSQIPDITRVVNGVKDDIVKKINEYNKINNTKSEDKK